MPRINARCGDPATVCKVPLQAPAPGRLAFQGVAPGQIGLYFGFATEAYFSKLRIEPN